MAYGIQDDRAVAGRVLVVGLGKTGLSCARYLIARGVEVAVTDTRLEPPCLAEMRAEMPDVALFLGGLDEQALARADTVVLSPGLSLNHPLIVEACRRGVDVIGDIELFARAAKAPVIAVTGSNGKSTVTTLVGQMAARAGRDVRVGGNLGVPALALLQEREPDLYVLELSSFQLETTFSLNAVAATVLNISPDHMDRYPDLESYMDAKRRIFQGDGVLVLNADDANVCAMHGLGRNVIFFTLGTPGPGEFGIQRRDGRDWLACGDMVQLPVDELRIAGRHNAANALAALALGAAVGLPREAMLDALREFPGLPHRTEWIAEAHGVNWYNDSKGTNVGATLAAVQGMSGQVVLIAGGDGKGADFTPMREALAGKARAVVLIGRDAALIEKALGGVVSVAHASSMDQAVRCARDLAQEGDVVLLSPACASFDMFTNYEERGQVFTESVRRLLT